MARFVTPSRDSVTTINQDGSRLFLHPADVTGRFASLRKVSALGLIALYAILPWISINGYPAVFLNVAERRFHLFGLTLVAEDLWLLFFLISGLAFLLFYVTALFGRIWCGYACPQTVFLEHVYRRVERWLEGDAPSRRKLDALPWSRPEKILRRGSKQLLFLFVSAAIAHLFLAYFVSIPELYRWMTTSPAEHWHAFVFVFAATGILYLNFAWFREQLCLIICPYGRLQSALIDDDSIVIGYDENRGEPRGRKNTPGAGDCIDCYRCVQVCPTGIDIRQGLQMECIGCSACVDACDQVMDRLDRPRGLIRYDSLNGLAGKKRRVLRPRIALYTGLLLAGMAVAGFSFAKYRPANLNMTRLPGAPYIVSEESIRNQFRARLINKLDEPMTFQLQDPGIPGLAVAGFTGAVTVDPMGESIQTVVLTMDRAAFTGAFEVTLGVEASPGGVELQRTLSFTGPDPRLLKEGFLAREPAPDPARSGD